METNLKTNGCRNVIALPHALGAESRKIDLFQVEENRGNLSFADIKRTDRSVSVSMRRGDELLEEFQLKPTVAKIDVEDAEPLVLSGLGDFKPNIFLFEFVPKHLCAQGFDSEEFLRSIAAEGYTLNLVDPDSGERTPATPLAIMGLAINQKRDFNILAMR